MGKGEKPEAIARGMLAVAEGYPTARSARQLAEKHGVSTPVMAELHGLLPESSFQVFAHARHGLPFSHGAQCAQVLRGFLERSGKRA